jgi:hypothetical protein
MSKYKFRLINFIIIKLLIIWNNWLLIQMNKSNSYN